MASLKPPIILVANARSGTTMTARCFAVHPAIHVWREPRGVWVTGNSHVGHDRFTEEHATPKVIKQIRAAFLACQESHGGRIVMEKTPANCLKVPFIRKVLPEAYIIHLIRDGRDSVSSAIPFWTRPTKQRRILRRLKETPLHEWPRFLPRFVSDKVMMQLGLRKRVKYWGIMYPGMEKDLKTLEMVEVIAKQWVAAVETAPVDIKAATPADQWTEARYEELVRSPVEHFERFLKLVRLEMTPELDTYLKTEVVDTSVGAWRKRLTGEQVAKIDPIIRPSMLKLGYTMD